MRQYTIKSLERLSDKFCLYIQLNAPKISREEFENDLNQELNQHSIFDEIYFIGTVQNLAQAKSWLSNSTIKDRLKKKAKKFEDEVLFLSFDYKTKKYSISGLSKTISQTESVESRIKSLKNSCLAKIFDESGALSFAPHGVHYKNPSGIHTNVFLRTSCVLEHPGNISILSFWLLEFMSDEIKEIYVDTTSISSLGIALIAEYQRTHKSTNFPNVISFRSYEGLENLRVTSPAHTLVLISATTSGRLKEKLISEKKVLSENVITIYSLDKKDDKNTLCFLGKYPLLLPKLKKISHYEGNNCKFCKSKTFLVPLGGDLFSVEPPKTVYVVIEKLHLPESSKQLVEKYSGTGLFKTYKNIDNNKIEIFLDISALFQKQNLLPHKAQQISSFKERWKKELYRSLTPHLKRIIYTDSPYSEELAKSAQTELRKKFKSHTAHLVKSRDLDGLKAKPDKAVGSSTLVISACMDNAYELTGINLDLRDIQPKGNVTYLSPVSRGKSPKERQRVKSTLTYGNSGPNAYDLYTVFSIDLPLCSKTRSWDKELDQLRAVKEWADSIDKIIPKAIYDRMELLAQGPEDGLSDNLFWSSSRDKSLKIRDDFVFIDNAKENNISQADVYVTTAIILHYMREGCDRFSPQLASQPYHRSILSPENFFRFNDGVIHASILRASRDNELDFMNASENESSRVKDFLLGRINDHGNDRSESLMEFLIALLTQSLLLHKTHTIEICSAAISKDDLPDHFKCVCEFMLYRLENELDL